MVLRVEGGDLFANAKNMSGKVGQLAPANDGSRLYKAIKGLLSKLETMKSTIDDISEVRPERGFAKILRLTRAVADAGRNLRILPILSLTVGGGVL